MGFRGFGVRGVDSRVSSRLSGVHGLWVQGFRGLQGLGVRGLGFRGSGAGLAGRLWGFGGGCFALVFRALDFDLRCRVWRVRGINS